MLMAEKGANIDFMRDIGGVEMMEKIMAFNIKTTIKWLYVDKVLL